MCTHSCHCFSPTFLSCAYQCSWRHMHEGNARPEWFMPYRVMFILAWTLEEWMAIVLVRRVCLHLAHILRLTLWWPDHDLRCARHVCQSGLLLHHASWVPIYTCCVHVSLIYARRRCVRSYMYVCMLSCFVSPYLYLLRACIPVYCLYISVIYAHIRIASSSCRRGYVIQCARAVCESANIAVSMLRVCVCVYVSAWIILCACPCMCMSMYNTWSSNVMCASFAYVCVVWNTDTEILLYFPCVT